jgi:hypothetical protein
MNVYQLTLEQRNSLVDETYDGVQFMNPPQDADGEYYLSQEVYNAITLVRANELGVISWWFDLPLVPYNPVIFEFPQ